MPTVPLRDWQLRGEILKQSAALREATELLMVTRRMSPLGQRFPYVVRAPVGRPRCIDGARVNSTTNHAVGAGRGES